VSTQRTATVISIASPPGGGKTTLSRLLSARLHDAPILHYDDHETLTRRSPAEIERWLDDGARLDEIPVPGYAEKLTSLKAVGRGHVVVDSPLGRAHRPTAAMIDFLFFIDTPLDIALARVLRKQATLAAHPPDRDGALKFAGWLEGYLDNYARFMHRCYVMQRAVVLPQADLVLDGTWTPDRLAESMLGALTERGL
jgi:uridine kinase